MQRTGDPEPLHRRAVARGPSARSGGPWPLCPALLCSALSLLCCAVAFPLPLIFCAWAVLCRAVLVLCCHRRSGGVFFSFFVLCSSPSSPRVANNCLCHSAIRAPILGVLCPAISFFSVVSFVFCLLSSFLPPKGKLFSMPNRYS